MSNSVMTTVWKQSKQEGTHRLLHVALADGVNDHGFGYHGVEFLAEKCAISDRQTQRLRDDLERDGEIYVQRGSGRGIKTQYLVCTGLDFAEIQWRLEKYFDMEFAEAKNVTLSVLEKRVTFLSKRVTSRDKKGDKNRVKGDISNSENEEVYSHGDKSNPVAPAATTINHNTEPYNLSLQKAANATSANANILGQEIDSLPDTAAQVKAKQDKAVAKLSEPTPADLTHYLQEKASGPKRKVPPKEKSPRKPKTDVPPPDEGVLDYICLMCYGTEAAFSLNASVIRKCYNDIAKGFAPVTLAQLRGFESWWKRNDWRGQDGQRPTTHQIKSLWATAQAESKGAISNDGQTAPNLSAGSGTQVSGGRESAPGQNGGQTPAVSNYNPEANRAIRDSYNRVMSNVRRNEGGNT